MPTLTPHRTKVHLPSPIRQSPASPAPPAAPAISLRECADRLFANGAVLTTPGQPPARDLVGELRWPSPNEIFWFTAYGDAPRDAHLLCFDETKVVRGCGIAFQRRSTVVGYLSSIDAAQLDDPDDYRIAWQLWQQVAPLRAPFIERCWQTLVRPTAE